MTAQEKLKGMMPRKADETPWWAHILLFFQRSKHTYDIEDGFEIVIEYKMVFGVIHIIHHWRIPRGYRPNS